MSHRKNVAPGFAMAAMLTIGFAGAARADQVVQVPVDALLNARAVTTLTGGRLVPWTIGIDGNGTGDGYMTAAASRFHNDPATLKTLPDDGRFAADARHPEVLLHFSNDADAAGQQTHYVRAAGTFTFMVPAATYSKMFLFFTSSEGTSTLKITMTYSDAMESVNVIVPDYYVNVPANDPVIFNLATDLPKWTQASVVAEMNHHNLTGVELHPMATKTLTGMQVDKTAPGYLVFWGATGIATGGDSDAGGDGSIGDARAVGDAPRDGDGGAVVVDAGGGAAGASVSGAGGGAGSSGGTGSGGGTGPSSGAGSGGSAASGSGGGSGSGSAGATTGIGGSSSVGTSGSSGSAGGQGAAPSDAGCACDLSRGSSNRSMAWGMWLLVAAVARRRSGKQRSLSGRSAPDTGER